MLALILSFAMAAEAISLRVPPPELLPDQARSMTGNDLASILLMPGHPPIESAIVHPSGMEAPARWVTRIELVSKGRPSTEPGFCSAERFIVAFKPTRSNDPALEETAARPTGVETDMLFRLPPDGQALSDVSCASSPSTFFRVWAQDRETELAAIRLLDRAQRVARKDRRAPFKLSIVDQEWIELDRLHREHPELKRGPKPPKRIVNPVEALIALPLSQIYSVEVNPVTAQTPEDSVERVCKATAPCTVQIAVGEEWLVDLTYRLEQVDQIEITRRIPPPF